MLHPICYITIWHLKHTVVATYLVNYLFIDLNIFLFTFHNHTWFNSLVVDHNVTTTAHSIECNGTLYLHKFYGVAQTLMQRMYYVLAHPFFGSKCHIATTHHIKYLCMSIVLAKRQVTGSNIKCG